MLCALLFGLLPASAQVLLTESFSDQASSTTKWIHGGTNTGAATWAWTNVKNAGNADPGDFQAPTAGDGYLWFDSDVNADFDHDVTLTGPMANGIDCSGKSDVRLYFYTYYRTYSGDDVARVGVSTDGVNFTYKNIKQFDDLIAEPANGPAQFYQGWLEIPLPEAANQSKVWIQFRWQGKFEYYWKVDDIMVTNGARPTDVTFRVNMAKQASVDPGGVRLATSLDGFASDEVMTDAGNGVWTLTKSIATGQKVQYKFKNGPNGWEKGNAACGVSDGFGGYNREVEVTGNVELAAICFDACGPCDLTCKQNPDGIICDDFETYTLTTVSPQAAWWIPWGAPDNNATLSGDVSNVVASNGTKSMRIRFQQVGTTQGDDQLLLLGNKSTGNYSLKWKMFIPTGKNAYYNVQSSETPGQVWTMDIYFGANGNDSLANPTPVVLSKYPVNQWFTVEHFFDLDNDLATLVIDGQVRRKWAYTQTLGSIDFYATDANSLFYVDEVEYVKLPATVYNADVCGQALDITSLLGAAPGVAKTTALLNNNTATASPTDPKVDCWNEDLNGGTDDVVNTSMWFTFTGDGSEYTIQTVPCTATNYIGTAQDDEGDTQMLLFAGSNCTDLTPLACNDDLFSDGEPDWRAGLDIKTENGKTYYVLVDAFEYQGVVSKGEFCVQVEQKASVTCADLQVGPFELDNFGFVCTGDNVSTYLTASVDSFVLSNIGPEYGFAWCLSAEPIPGNTWPASAAGFITSTAFNPAGVTGLTLPNDGTVLQPGVYYLTPVVMAGGEKIDATDRAWINNIDSTSVDCYAVGESKLLALLPELDPIDATGVISTILAGAPGKRGAIDLTISGGFATLIQDPTFYAVQWSTGATTQDLTGLAAGTYTVVIVDPTGCTDPFTTTFTVSASVGTEDPASVKSLTLAPNPAADAAALSLTLKEAAAVRIDVINTLGQTLQTIDAGITTRLNQPLDLKHLAAGSYMVRVTVGSETALRRLVIQR